MLPLAPVGLHSLQAEPALSRRTSEERPVPQALETARPPPPRSWPRGRVAHRHFQTAAVSDDRAAAPAETRARRSNGLVDLRRAPSPIPSVAVRATRCASRRRPRSLVGPLMQFASCHVTGESAGPIRSFLDVGHRPSRKPCGQRRSHAPGAQHRHALAKLAKPENTTSQERLSGPRRLAAHHSTGILQGARKLPRCGAGRRRALRAASFRTL